MQEKLIAIKEAAFNEINSAETSSALEEIRVKYLGKKGELTTILKSMGGLSKEERPVVGKMVNDVKKIVEEQLDSIASKIKEKEKNEKLRNEVIDITELDPLTKLKNEIIEKLKQRQIKETQSLKLLKEKTLKNLNKISKIIEYYDYLVGIKSVLVSKSPVGFLYRAIEKEDTFYLPPKFSIKEDDVEHEVKHVKKSKSENREQLQKVFWEERNSQIDEIRKEIDEKFLREIEEEARKSLSNMKGMISSINFEKAVTNRVNDKLASLYALSSFDEWLKERKSI